MQISQICPFIERIPQTCSLACRCSFLILSSLRRTGSSWRSTLTPRWRSRERLCSVTSRQSVTRSSDRPRQYSPTALIPEAWSPSCHVRLSDVRSSIVIILPTSVTRQQPVMSRARRLGQYLAIPTMQSSVMLYMLPNITRSNPGNFDKKLIKTLSLSSQQPVRSMSRRFDLGL